MHLDEVRGILANLIAQGANYIIAALGYTPANRAGDTFTGAVIAPSLQPNGTGVPSNGLYLPAVNRISWSTNATFRGSMDENGNWILNATTAQNYGSPYRTIEGRGDNVNTGAIFQSSSSDLSVKCRMFIDSAQGFVGVSTAHKFNIQAGGTTVATYDTSGNYLLGVSAAGTSAAKVLGMANATAPTTSPAGMGQLYVEAGALKFRGSSGTVTTVAPA